MFMSLVRIRVVFNVWYGCGCQMCQFPLISLLYFFFIALEIPSWTQTVSHCSLSYTDTILEFCGCDVMLLGRGRFL